MPKLGETGIGSYSAPNTFQCLKEPEPSTRLQVMEKRTSRLARNMDYQPSRP